MRLVTDTNIIVSALLWGGTPRLLIQAAVDENITLLTSEALIAELWTVVSRPKFDIQMRKRGITARGLLDGYVKLAKLVHPTSVERVIARDPADDEVLAAAVAARADLIVSGDAHLLDLRNYCDIPIVRVRDALERIDAH